MINVFFLFGLYCGFGSLFYRFLIKRDENNNWQRATGESFFMGVFVLVLINNTLQYFAIPIAQTWLFNIVLIITIITILFGSYRLLKTDSGSMLFSTGTSVGQLKSNLLKMLMSNKYHFLLSVVILVHLYYIISQNQSLPLTPWDSWYGWIAKAKIWFYHGLDELLVNRPQWLLADSKFTNSTAHYPDALPLLYVFNSGFFGWDETALNGIYPAMFVALLLAFYGHIKLLINKNYALLAVVILSTIPFINTHVILAGYADIWVAAYLVLCVFNIQHFLNKPRAKDLLLTTVFMISMLMFKLESWVWLSIFILVMALTLVNKRKRHWAYLALLLALVVWYVLHGFGFNTTFGQVEISPHMIKIPAFGVYELAFVNTTSAWIEALFYSNNWNLLWYSIPFVVWLYWKNSNKDLILFPALFLVFTLFFLYILFYMTYASIFANDFTSSNRIVLHIVPLYVYFSTQLVYIHRQQKLN
jgi:hypothetical protein